MRIYLRSTYRLAVSLCLALCLALPAVVHAGPATDQIRETVDAVIAVLNNKELKKPDRKQERRKKIRDIVNKRFDFEEMAKRALGQAWAKRTPEERKAFVALFSDLLQNTYIRKVERYERQSVAYTEERVDGQYAVVRTKVSTEKEVDIPVEYRIFKEKDKWEAYDIIIEGVSLVNNYRNQFNSLLRSGSFDDLLKKLREKINKDEE